MSASAASLLVASLSWRRMPADLSLLILLKERQSQTRQQKLGSKISIVILSKLYSPGELEKGLKFKRVIKNKKFNYLHFILSYYRSISHYAYIIVNFFFYFFHSPLMKVKKQNCCLDVLLFITSFCRLSGNQIMSFLISSDEINEPRFTLSSFPYLNLETNKKICEFSFSSLHIYLEESTLQT